MGKDKGISQLFINVYEETQQVEYSLNGSSIHILNAMVQILKSNEEFRDLFCDVVDTYRNERTDSNSIHPPR